MLRYLFFLYLITSLIAKSYRILSECPLSLIILVFLQFDVVSMFVVLFSDAVFPMIGLLLEV